MELLTAVMYAAHTHASGLMFVDEGLSDMQLHISFNLTIVSWEVLVTYFFLSSMLISISVNIQ